MKELPIAELFASVGFKINTKDVDTLNRKLKEVEATVTSFKNNLEGAYQKVDRAMASAQRAMKAELDIQIKKNRIVEQGMQVAALRARTEAAIDRAKALAAKPMLEVEKAKARLQLAEIQSGKALIQQQTAQIALQRQQLALATAQAKANTLNNRAQAAGQGLRGLIGGMVGGPLGFLSTIGLAGFGIHEGLKQARELQAQERSLQVSTGSEKLGKQEFQYVQKYAQGLGINVATASSEYARILGAAEGTKMAPMAKGTFEAFTKYGAALHLDDTKMRGILLATTEMMGMGKVYQRQLNMLSIRAPHMVKLLADSVAGGSEERLHQMTKAGLRTEDVLPKLIEQLNKESGRGGALEAYKRGSQAETERTKNLFAIFAKDIYESGLDKTLAAILHSLNGILEVLSPLIIQFVKITSPIIQDGLKTIGGSFSAIKKAVIDLYEHPALAGIAAAFALITTFFLDPALLGRFFTSIFMGLNSFAKMGKVILLEWLPLILAFAVIQDVLYGLTGYGKSVTGEAMKGQGPAGGVGRFGSKLGTGMSDLIHDPKTFMKEHILNSITGDGGFSPNASQKAVPENPNRSMWDKFKDWNMETPEVDLKAKPWQVVPSGMNKPTAININIHGGNGTPKQIADAVINVLSDIHIGTINSYPERLS